MRPHAAGIKSSPAPVRIRSYAPRKTLATIICAIIKQFIMGSPLNGGSLNILSILR